MQDSSVSIAGKGGHGSSEPTSASNAGIGTSLVDCREGNDGQQSSECLRVGDWCWLLQKYFDLNQGTLVEIFLEDESSVAFRAVLIAGKYNETGYYVMNSTQLSWLKLYWRSDAATE